MNYWGEEEEEEEEALFHNTILMFIIFLNFFDNTHYNIKNRKLSLTQLNFYTIIRTYKTRQT